MAQTARQLVVQGSTDTLPQESRNAIADQIDQLIAGMKQEANATYDGRYVLGGNRTNVRPYDATATTTDPSVPTNDAYAGDSANQLREIGPGVTMVVNVHGDEVLGGAPGSTGDMLGVMRDIATHLRSGDTAALGTDDLKADPGPDRQPARRAGARRRGYEPPRHRIGAPAGDRGVDDVDALEHRGRRHGRDARRTSPPSRPSTSRRSTPARGSSRRRCSTSSTSLRVQTTMTQTLKSTRFGDVELSEDAVVDFPNGLIGLQRPPLRADPARRGRHVRLAALDGRPRPRAAADEAVDASSRATRSSCRTPRPSASASTTPRRPRCSSPSAPPRRRSNFSANLRAPIIISGGRGFQVINEADDAPVRAPLFAQPVG